MLYSAFVFAYMPAAGLSLNSWLLRDRKKDKFPMTVVREND